MVRANLRKGIRDVNVVYKQRIEDDFSDPRWEWQSICQITGQNNTNRLANNSVSMAEQLNQFFSHFKVKSTTTATIYQVISNQALILQSADVICTQKINAQNVAGPDGAPGLKDWASEFGEVFTLIFININSHIIT